MVCKKCKKEIPDGAVFCPWCGIKQQREQTKRVRSNGEGSVFQRAGQKSWTAEISIYQDGQRYRAAKSGFKTRRAALEYMPQLREVALEGKAQSNDATLVQIWEMLQDGWMAGLSKDKASHMRTAWAHILPLGNAKIRNLRYGDLQPLIDAREGGYYPKRDIKALLHKMYQTALKYEWCDRDYTELLDLPPNKASARSALTMDEIDLIWKDYHAGHGFSRYWLIMAYTGMRSGEMRTIRKANTHLPEQYCTGGIKTDAGRARQIIFADKIMPLVKEAYKEGKTLLCEASEKDFYSQWAEMCQRTGLQGVTPYCLRHTTATLLATEDVPPAIIQQIMGHTSYAITAEHYTHIPLEDKLDALNRL